MASIDDIRNRFRGAFVGAVVGNAFGERWTGMNPEEISEVTGGRGVNGLTTQAGQNGSIDVWQGRVGAATASLFAAAESLILTSGTEPVVRTATKKQEIPGSVADVGCDSLPCCVPLMMLQAIRRLDKITALSELKRYCSAAHGEPIVYLGAAALAPLLTWPFTHYRPLTNARSTLEEAMNTVDVSMKLITVGDAAAHDHLGPLFDRFVLAMSGVHDHLKLRQSTGNRMSLLEAVPFIALVSLRNSRDFEYAMLETVNAGGDTSNTAALVGAIIGANVGIGGIPKKFVKEVPESVRAIELADALYALTEDGTAEEPDRPILQEATEIADCIGR